MGAAVRLARRPRKQIDRQSGDRSIRATTGSEWLVIRAAMIPADYLQTYEHCVARLQAELDLVSVNIGIHMVATDVQNEHVAWWPSVDGSALRYVKIEA